MIYISRLDSKMERRWKTGPALVAAACMALAMPAFAGDSAMQMVSVIDDTPALMMHGSQGYLGVTIHDVDSNRAAVLGLKDARGAEIVMLDHDAPACKAGLRPHDVILQMNGQAIDGIEPLRRMLRDTPVGKTVSLLIWRDGQTQTFTIQLGDRAKLEQQPLNPSTSVDPGDSTPAENYVPVVHQTEGTGGGRNNFFGPLSLNRQFIGAIVDPVGPQLADYFGVKDGTGLLVRRVDDGSPAATAGMKAGDVVLKVNGRTMATLDDWQRAIHKNRGKQLQVVVVRDRKEQTLTMSAAPRKTKG